MDTEHDPIGEQLDTFAGTKLVYQARICALAKRGTHPEFPSAMDYYREYNELTARLAQLLRELGRFIQRHSSML